MILALTILCSGGLLLVFSTHLLNRLEGEEIFPFWLWSLGMMFVGFIGLAMFTPLVTDSSLAAFGSVMSLAVSAFGLAGIIKTLPPL